MSATALPNLIAPFAVADWLQVSVGEVERMARRQQIPHIILPGGRLRFDADELAAWMEKFRAREGVEDRRAS
jgi:excisionase family DNA binding protein